MTDAFAVGFMNQGLTPSIWTTISLGLGVFLGGNLIIACIISGVLAGIGFPLVWGILGGSMPRSGGEYIYNSRIIHPIFGIAQSFGDAVIWLMWIYVLAPLAVDPGLTMTFRFLGWNGAADWLVSSSLITFAIATVLNVVGFLFVVFGIKIFAKVQKGVMFFGIGGCVLLTIVLSVTSRATFMARWDAYAASSGTPGLTYQHFIDVVAKSAGAIPTTWNWYDTLGVMVAMSWLFAYAYSISFIAGEVKRPDKSIIWANVFAIGVPFVFMLWTAFALYHSVGFQFLSAAAWNDPVNGSGPAAGAEGLKWGSNYVVLGAIMVGTGSWAKLAAAIMGLSYFAFVLWWLALTYLAFPRILFAWGMDRMGPKWFTDISPRWASPVKNYVVCFVITEIMLVVYFAWLTSAMQNITVTGMQMTSVFIPTAVAALLFPYMKRCKGVWESSPYKTWRFLGLPVVVWGALVGLAYLGLLMYFFIFGNAAGLFTLPSVILFVAVWVLGVAWYYFWKGRSRNVGVDVSMTYGELPPE